MSTRKLTFSLASLIVLIGLLAAPAFVYAETVSTVAFTSTPSAAKGGNYGPGDKVQVTVTFSGAVDVVTTGGTPTIALTNDDAGVGALSYASGSGTAALIFESAALITNGATDTDGLQIGANSMTLNGGFIYDAGSTTDAATITHTAGLLVAAQTVDLEAPTYNYAANTNPFLVSSAPYHVGEEIEVRLAFGEAMVTAGAIAFQIGNGTNPDRYLHASASGTPANTVTFSYTVQSGDSGRARINGQIVPRSIKDEAGNLVSATTQLLGAATLDLGNVSTTQPTVTAVAITSTGPYTDTTAHAIEVTVTFSESVAVTGTPQIELTIGAGKAKADYASGSGSAALVFSYSIVDTDAGAVSIAANALALNGGSINAIDTFQNPAVLTHDAVMPTDTNQNVGAPPSTTDVTVGSKSYVVVVPPNHDAAALPANATPHTISNFPDLSIHFVTGGTIDIVVTGGAKHDVVISEIMLARDLAKAGGAGTMRPEAAQWIELYNKTDAAKTVTLNFSKGYPADDSATGTTDRLSSAVAPGWDFNTTFSGALTGSTQKGAEKNFVSLRRKQKDNAYFPAGTILDGWSAGSWTLTDTSKVFLAGRIGTPGMVNRVKAFTPAKFTAPAMNVTFSEIANRSDDTNEWIELKGPAGTNLKKYKIDLVTTYNSWETVYHFPDNDSNKIHSSGVFLLTDQNPAENELAAVLENGVPKDGVRYRIATLADLPNDGNFLLVLRDGGGKIQDVAGHVKDNALKKDNPYTTLWPLAGNVGTISSYNTLASGKVYARVRNIQGYSATAGNKLKESAFGAAGFTGIGYDRNATVSDVNGGTPGYPNGASISAGGDATKNIVISEIMYNDGDGRLAQWIELQNLSHTHGVNLHNWRLYIVNHAKGFDGKVMDEVWLRNMQIPPRQTALIVSRAGRNTTNLPKQRLMNLRRAKQLLNPMGFYLKLEAKSNEGDVNKRQAGDEAGNLVAFDPTDRRDHQAYTDPAWALPSGMDETGSRVSIARRTSPKLQKLDGLNARHWVVSDIDRRISRMTSITYYGRVSDIGSPGQSVGSVLPVSLSKFRAERLESGEIVIRWTTESELDNAGFNILRSETRDGQFTKLNEQMIAGQGTTSERTAYDFVDKTAKPNVVYYYQIQDVSLDGDVATLRTSRLKGYISAADKLTTTWGELKALQ